MAGQRPSPRSLAQAAVHGYTTAFWWSAAIFAVGAASPALLRPAHRRPPGPERGAGPRALTAA